MAVIESLFTGKDNGVHSANIHTRNAVTNRPVTKLYPLEVTNRSDVELIHKENVIEDASDTVTTNRLRCDAAQRARQQIAKWVERIEALRRMLRIVDIIVIHAYTQCRLLVLHNIL